MTMKILEALNNDYFRLFIKREGKVVLGKKLSSLWLLTGVLVATFLAISFSNASLEYLSYKMDDPFINWVDIKNDYGKGNFSGLEYSLDSEENKEKFHYYSYQADYASSLQFFGKTLDIQYLRCRFQQEMNTSLTEAILSKDNVVKGWRVKDLSEVAANTLGVILTEEAMKKLGYDSAPAYIDYVGYAVGYDYVNASVWGVEVFEDKFARMPVPVLAVVKRLPGNVDVLSNVFFYEQIENDITYPFNIKKNEEYVQNLNYFVPSEVSMDEFRAALKSINSDYTDAEIEVDEYSFYVPEIVPFKEGDFVRLNCFYDTLDNTTWSEIDVRLNELLSGKGIKRVYEYNFRDKDLSQKAFLSIHFKDLDALQDFEKYVRDEFNVKIEMSQINAKENFNAVSTMGNILSWGIIIFAIVCIILFIVNLLQSYFQKVKRNLGTFKAFGICNRDLISVYVLIMAAIILAAIAMSLSAVWFTQGLLHLCGILKDGVFDYLSLWSIKTVCSIIVIVTASIYTVYAVMHKLLKSTPGDLIYDRQ